MTEKSQLLDASREITRNHVENRTIPVLSKLTGLSRSYLQHFASGKIKNPGVKQVETILKVSDHPYVSHLSTQGQSI